MNPDFFEKINCNLCGQEPHKILYNSPLDSKQTDFLVTTDRFDRYGTIVKCSNCGLVYTNPRIPETQARASYENMVDLSYQNQDASRSINGYLSLNTIKRFIRGGKLLDVGCATGYFLNAARIEFDVSGVEVCRWAGDYANEKLKLNVKNGSLFEAKYPEKHFDVVTMIDTIEHLHDPKSMIQEISRITRPNGWIYCMTPDIQSFSAKLLGRKWWGLRPAHIYYFSTETLKKMLESNGYQVKLVRSFGKIFTMGYWASRLKNYPAFINGPVNRVIDLFGLQEKFFYLNTRDSIEVLAQKID